MRFRFDCLCYYTANLARSVEFYRDILGLQLVSIDVVARFSVDGVLFELVPATGQMPTSGGGNARLVLAFDDTSSAAAYLKNRGVTVSDIQRVENGWLAPFYDPDGNEIMLWQYA
jgi:catechol 2,3-dioxygenase-like lactoylglutathione lyase family enzyme